VVLFLLLLGSYAYFCHGPGWGQVSRMNLVMAVVDEGTLRLDSYEGTTGDSAVYQGHTYHEKAPGGAFAGIAPYWLYSRFVTRPDMSDWPAWSAWYGRALYVTTVATVGALSALGGVALFCLVYGLFGDRLGALLTVLIYGLGTMVLVYAGQFQSHQLAGALVCIGLYLGWGARHAAGSSRAARLMAVGFCLAYAVASEYQDVFLALAAAVYLLVTVRPRRHLLWLVLGAVPPVLLVAAFNRACFGEVFTAGYAHVSSPRWQAVHRGALLGFGPPRLRVWATLMFSRWRGLVWFSPAVLLAVPGAILWWRRRDHRPELILAVFVLLLFPLYLSGFGAILTGHQFGPRFLVPALPFAALLTAAFVARRRTPAILVGALSLVLALAGAAVNPQPPPSFRRPISEYYLPNLVAADFPLTSYGPNPAMGVTRPIDYRPFTLATPLGLTGHATLAPLLAWWLLGIALLTWLAQRPSSRPTAPGN